MILQLLDKLLAVVFSLLIPLMFYTQLYRMSIKANYTFVDRLGLFGNALVLLLYMINRAICNLDDAYRLGFIQLISSLPQRFILYYQITIKLCFFETPEIVNRVWDRHFEQESSQNENRPTWMYRLGMLIISIDEIGRYYPEP